MMPLKIEKDCIKCGHAITLPDGKCQCPCHQFVAKMTKELFGGDLEKMKEGLNKEINRLETDPTRALMFRIYALGKYLEEMEQEERKNASTGWTVEK